MSIFCSSRGCKHELALLLSVGCTKRTIWKGWGRVTFGKPRNKDPPRKDEQRQHLHLSVMLTAGTLIQGGEWPLTSVIFLPPKPQFGSHHEKHQNDLNWEGPFTKYFHIIASKLHQVTQNKESLRKCHSKKSLRRHGN